MDLSCFGYYSLMHNYYCKINIPHCSVNWGLPFGIFDLVPKMVISCIKLSYKVTNLNNLCNILQLGLKIVSLGSPKLRVSLLQ